MNSDQLPNWLDVVATADDRPLPGAWVEIELPTDTKNSYRFPIGPADDHGHLRISRSDLTQRARQIKDLFPMDYVGLDASWTGEIIVKPVNCQDVERLRKAHATWGHTDFYTREFPVELNRLEIALATLPAETALDINLAAEPADSCRTATRSSRVS